MEGRGRDEAMKRNQDEQRAVNVNARGGSTVNAPVMFGNNFHGSVNYNSTPVAVAQPPVQQETRNAPVPVAVAQPPVQQATRNAPVPVAVAQPPVQQATRNAPMPVEEQPIQSDWMRPDRIIPSRQEFKNRIIRRNRDDVYIPKDKSQRKRVALLITNTHDRPGAERDEENMEWLLTALGYRVEKYTNLPGKEIEDAVEKFAALPDHKDSDSTFVVIMSHGDKISNKDAIAGVNYHHKHNPNDYFFVDTIFTRLNSVNCPALIDKPKIILIQACRGGHPGGVKMSDSTHDSDAEDSALDSDTWVHKEKDFTCFMSTLPDIKAYRRTVSGSYFVMSIVEVFCEWAQDTHIMELFRKVTSDMAKRPGREKNKLLPCIERTSLTKNFYLFPGH